MRSKGIPVAGVFSRFYDEYSRRFGFGEAFHERVVEEAALEPGESVLDCGCGTGTLVMVAKRRVGPGGRVVGIDISEDQLTKAMSKAKKQMLEIGFHKGSIDELPFPDSCFDAIFSTLMLHHVPRQVKERAFREMLRVLKPAGRAVIVDFGPPARFFIWMLVAPMVLMFLAGSTTRDNLFNRIPGLMSEAGFSLKKHTVIRGIAHLIKAEKLAD